MTLDLDVIRLNTRPAMLDGSSSCLDARSSASGSLASMPLGGVSSKPDPLEFSPIPLVPSKAPECFSTSSACPDGNEVLILFS